MEINPELFNKSEWSQKEYDSIKNQLENVTLLERLKLFVTIIDGIGTYDFFDSDGNRTLGSTIMYNNYKDEIETMGKVNKAAKAYSDAVNTLAEDTLKELEKNN